MKFEVKLKRNIHLHSREHVLADDLSRTLNEPKRFASYLGIARLYYEEDLRALLRRVAEKENLPLGSRGKYFFAALKGLRKKPGVTFRRARKKAVKSQKRKRKLHGKTSRTTRTK